MGHRPWGHEESDTTERLTLRTSERYGRCLVCPTGNVNQEDVWIQNEGRTKWPDPTLDSRTQN